MPTTPQIHAIEEVELLRIKVAHLEYQLAQVQAQMQLQQLSTSREALIKQAMRAHVPEEDLEQYVIDLEAGVLRPREQPEG